MGYRPNRTRPANAPGACIEGRQHVAVPVTLLTGETVAHVCEHCLVRLRGLRPPGAPVSATMWLPYSDDGQPLHALPDPSHRTRR